MSAHDDFTQTINRASANFGAVAQRGGWVGAGGGQDFLMSSTPRPDAARLDSRDLDEIAGRHYAEGWRDGQADLYDQIRDAIASAAEQARADGLAAGLAEERNWWLSNVAHDVRALRARVQDERPTKKRDYALALAESLAQKVAGRRA